VTPTWLARKYHDRPSAAVPNGFFSGPLSLAAHTCPSINMATSKYVADHELIGEKLEISHSEVMHFGQLTEEELVIEKKLRRKIDMLIMPLVILVYLMNYIDR
jgi:hypothetical protein